MTFGTGPEVWAVEFVETGARQVQFAGGLVGGEFLAAVSGQEMADERSGQALDQLGFFMGARVTGEDGFFAFKLMPAGLAGRSWRTARPAVYQAPGGAQVASPQSPILR